MANPDSRVALESERLTAEAHDRRGELIARWRHYEELRTGQRPTCSDAVALRLAELASLVGRL
jgi:hypothetical protein